MAFPSMFSVLLIFSLVGSSFSVDEAYPRGCCSLLLSPFTAICDLDAVWGVVVSALAGVAALTSVILALVLLCRCRRIMEGETRSGVAPLLLLLGTIFVLCGASFSHVIECDESVCIGRRTLLGALFALSIAYLITQGVRLFRCAGFRPLAGVAIGMAIMQVIYFVEWILNIVQHSGQPACQYQPQHISLALMHGLTLLIVVPVILAWHLIKRQQQRCRIIWLLITSVTSAILWATWLYSYHYLNFKNIPSSNWEDKLKAEFLVAQTWVLLLLHAAPEAHACLHQAPHPGKVSPAQASLEEGIPQPPQQIVESQARSEMEEPRPSTSCHIEMSEVNSSAVSAAPSFSSSHTDTLRQPRY